jgi:para-nitrobenzyl esterase
MKERSRPVVSARRLLIVVVAAYAALAVGWSGATFAQGVVPTDNGPVRGADGTGVTKYLGIPYAAPPVGDLRWRPPQPAARWRTPLDASHFAPHCPQSAGGSGQASTNEDCLYLNVWAPNDSPGRGQERGLPVMFWIHGGGFTSGESDDYDPSRLVKQGVVVVTINYRLGFLGFLAHPALTAESSYGGSGNYGLMDQQVALRWVDRNIRKFGGDPNNVTIFGESAGGLSVLEQLASPLATGLFDRAISQSGSYSLSLPSLATAENRGQGLAFSVGCPDQTAACLRNVPVSNLLAKQSSTPGAFVGNLDGHVLPQSMKTAFANGEFNQVPVIEGTTEDEFRLFYATEVELKMGNFGKDPFIYPFVVAAVIQAAGLNVSLPAVLAEYPLDPYPSIAEAVSAMATDAVFSCPSRRALQSLSQHVPTYGYEFADRNAPVIFPLPPLSFPLGAYHASELPSLFDSPTLGHAPLSPDQEKLAAAMVGYWTHFAETATPGPPSWPAYSVANDTFQSLVPPTPQPDTGFAAAHKCTFWDAHLGT